MMSDEKKPELDTLVLGQPTLKPMSDREVIAEFLEQHGYSHAEAQEKAAEALNAQANLDPGVTYGHIHAEQLADLWKRAARSGKRKIVLEISADALDRDEWDGHIQVEVKDAQTWDEYEQAQAEARAKEVN